jgi:hypothetical protein
MTPEQAIINLLEEKDVPEDKKKFHGKIVPTFNRAVGTAFWMAGKINLSKKLFEMSDKGLVVKDFIRWKPPVKVVKDEQGNVVETIPQYKDNGDGTLSLNVDGVACTRKVGKDGRISEAIFYLPAAVPAWVGKRAIKQAESNNLANELKEMLKDHIGEDEVIKKEFEEEQPL